MGVITSPIMTGLLVSIGGSFLLLYKGNAIVRRLPFSGIERLLALVYVGPAVVALAVYLVASSTPLIHHEESKR